MGRVGRIILVVEDEPVLLMNVADELAEAGFAVIESSNAHHALRQIENIPGISVIFTDVDMPGPMDGLDLSAIVHDRWPAVTVIVTSGKLSYDEAALPEDILFIPKPYSVGQLVHTIHSALAK